MSVDIDATPHLLLLIQHMLCIVQYRHGRLSVTENYALVLVKKTKKVSATMRSTISK